ncbi:MAG TPA: hypothetical protein VHB50_05505, partial [Bryobacteraceae bacterium]|nr:hypothetical protein [Bryobacteraceae bacterium]
MATRWGAGLSSAAALLVDRFGSADAVQRYQTARLRALLRHAYEKVPYYRRRFDSAGIHPAQVRTLEDLKRLPVTPKSDLRELPEDDVLARDCDRTRLLRYGTGGSTGLPTEIRFTPFEDRLLRLMRVQVLMKFGLRLTDRRAGVVFCKTPHPQEDAGLLGRFGILRSRAVHCMSSPEQIVSELREFRPDAIRGYSSALSGIAGKLTGEDRKRIRPRFITTDSENLTALARERIESGFGAPVFDLYDCFECNVIAYQCPRGHGYHVLDTAVVVEVLNGDRPALPGECGEVAITPLHSWAAPLIRYMPGDIVEQGPRWCPCGAPNACLTKIYGRTQDRFILPRRPDIHPGIFAAWIYPLCPGLRRYQIVQETRDRVVIRLQPLPGARIPEAQLETMRRGMTRDLGEEIALRIDMVDDIPSEPNGKFRPYRCEVN